LTVKGQKTNNQQGAAANRTGNREAEERVNSE